MTKQLRTFEEFRDLLAAYRLPRVIFTALELDLFTTMGSPTWAVGDLARKLDVSERGLRILCRNLAMAGLLIKQGECYRTGKLAATLLNASHPDYRGHYLGLLKNHWSDWSRLGESVKTGRPLDHDQPEAPGYRRSFTWAMHHRTLEVAPKIAAQLPLHGVKTLLDLGGGPGTYAMAFLARNSGLKATVCDRPAALEVAKEIAATHKAGARLSYLPLDLLAEDIPGSYDAVWYSNVLHIYSPAQNLALFHRVRAAVNPGGRFMIQDAFLHDREGLFPQEATLFAVTMLLFTETGDTYSVADTSGWLKKAGFGRITMRRMKKGTEDWEGGILEAMVPGAPAQTNNRRPGSRGNYRGRSHR